MKLRKEKRSKRIKEDNVSFSDRPWGSWLRSLGLYKAKSSRHIKDTAICRLSKHNHNSRGTTTMIDAIKIHWGDYTDKEFTFDASWPESIDIATLQSIQSLYNPQRSTYPDPPKSAMPPQPQMITSVTARETTEPSQSTSK